MLSILFLAYLCTATHPFAPSYVADINFDDIGGEIEDVFVSSINASDKTHREYSSCVISLSGVSISGCYGFGSTLQEESGGFIFAFASDVWIKKCSFSYDVSSIGGSLSFIQSNFFLEKCVFIGDHCLYNGGSVFVSKFFSNEQDFPGYSGTIQSSSFTNCSSDGSYGAVSLSLVGDVILQEVNFIECCAGYSGGALGIYESVALITGCNFANNYVMKNQIPKSNGDSVLNYGENRDAKHPGGGAITIRNAKPEEIRLSSQYRMPNSRYIFQFCCFSGNYVNGYSINHKQAILGIQSPIISFNNVSIDNSVEDFFGYINQPNTVVFDVTKTSACMNVIPANISPIKTKQWSSAGIFITKYAAIQYNDKTYSPLPSSADDTPPSLKHYNLSAAYKSAPGISRFSSIYVPLFKRTFIETPQLTPDSSPQNTPLFTPEESPYDSPQNTPLFTPEESPYDSPQNTPLFTTSESLNPSPLETQEPSPFSSPQITPIITHDITVKRTPINLAVQTPMFSPIPTPTRTALPTGKIEVTKVIQSETVVNVTTSISTQSNIEIDTIVTYSTISSISVLVSSVSILSETIIYISESSKTSSLTWIQVVSFYPSFSMTDVILVYLEDAPPDEQLTNSIGSGTIILIAVVCGLCVLLLAFVGVYLYRHKDLSADVDSDDSVFDFANEVNYKVKNMNNNNTNSTGSGMLGTFDQSDEEGLTKDLNEFGGSEAYTKDMMDDDDRFLEGEF